MPDVIHQFPHCCASVLHTPSTCQYCDEHPDWQQLREVWGINFTGENDPNKIPCPSTRRRSLNAVHAWPNNRPHPVGDTGGLFGDLPAENSTPKTTYDHLREDNFDVTSFTEDDD